jgi:hypothetical protein
MRPFFGVVRADAPAHLEEMAELASLVLGLIIVVALAPPAVWAVQFAKRQHGSAVVVTGLLLIFGMNMQIIPPPPPVAELARREAEEDDED